MRGEGRSFITSPNHVRLNRRNAMHNERNEILRENHFMENMINIAPSHFVISFGKIHLNDKETKLSFDCVHAMNHFLGHNDLSWILLVIKPVRWGKLSEASKASIY